MSNWIQTTDVPDFKKWGYIDSPYRVIAQKNDRGHWEALFTSAYGPPNKLIRGNLGGGKGGEIKATATARQFMEENKFGCAPPAEIAL